MGELIFPSSQVGSLAASASKKREYTHSTAALFPVYNLDEHGCHKRSSRLELDTSC